MPPKKPAAAGGGSKKAEQKKKEKVIEVREIHVLFKKLSLVLIVYKCISYVFILCTYLY